MPFSIRALPSNVNVEHFASPYLDEGNIQPMQTQISKQSAVPVAPQIPELNRFNSPTMTPPQRSPFGPEHIAQFAKLLTSPYLTIGGLNYLLGNVLKLMQLASREESAAEANAVRALAIAPRFMDLIGNMYRAAADVIDPTMKAVVLNRAISLEKSLYPYLQQTFGIGAIPSPTQESSEKNVAEILNLLKGKK